MCWGRRVGCWPISLPQWPARASPWATWPAPSLWPGDQPFPAAQGQIRQYQTPTAGDFGLAELRPRANHRPIFPPHHGAREQIGTRVSARGGGGGGGGSAARGVCVLARARISGIAGRAAIVVFARICGASPAIAQLAEHLTVDVDRNQMVPGSIPGGRNLRPGQAERGKRTG